MQHGFVQRICRKRSADVWQFRWSETGPDGKRTHHKKVLGTVEQFADEHSARRAVVALITEINADLRLSNSRAITVAELCDHFEQRELAEQNSWRSHATKKIYKAYLNRWVRPHWQRYTLAEVRTIQVESWLRTLPLAKSSCAKIRNLMSVPFNHACRYELSNMVCKSTSPWAAARSNAASVPTTFSPRCRAIVTPSRSSINKRMAWSSDASDIASRSPASRCAGAESTGCFRLTTSNHAGGCEIQARTIAGVLHEPARPSQREGSKPFDTVLEEYRLLG
jgi:hypothetical protein